MTDDRRRSTDPMLAELFRQNERQHSDNVRAREEDTRKLDAINSKLGDLLRTDDRHDFRLTGLEAWRRDHADPTLKMVTDSVSQAKGASKLVKFIYTACGLLGGGIIYKVGVAVIANLPK